MKCFNNLKFLRNCDISKKNVQSLTLSDKSIPSTKLFRNSSLSCVIRLSSRIFIPEKKQFRFLVQQEYVGNRSVIFLFHNDLWSNVEPHSGAAVCTQRAKWPNCLHSRIVAGAVCCWNVHRDGVKYPLLIFLQCIVYNFVLLVLQLLIFLSVLLFRIVYI